MSLNMPEPTSSSIAGGVFAWKASGGLAAVGAIGAGLAAIVVMCMTPPRSSREWVVGIISTVMGSIAGGATIIQHFNLTSWLDTTVGLVAVLGLVFASGLPAWALVRWTFNYIIARNNQDIGQVFDDAKSRVTGK
jgi:hypothetical protein